MMTTTTTTTMTGQASAAGSLEERPDAAGAMRIGPHRLLCGDLTCGAVSTLMGDERADEVYSDPPWGPGNQKYWHTMRERGSAPRTPWPDFLRSFCESVRDHRKLTAPVFVEMGLRWERDLLAAMAEVGLPHVWTQRVVYGAPKLPNLLLLFGARVDVDVEGMGGKAMTRKVLEACVLPGHIVLDPCTGLGMTARFADDLGAAFRGCELNPKRLDVTASLLRRRHGE